MFLRLFGASENSHIFFLLFFKRQLNNISLFRISLIKKTMFGAKTNLSAFDFTFIILLYLIPSNAFLGIFFAACRKIEPSCFCFVMLLQFGNNIFEKVMLCEDMTTKNEAFPLFC